MGKKAPSLTIESALFIITVILSALGLVFVFESSVAEAFSIFKNQYYFVQQQSIRLLLGFIALAGVQLIPLSWWKKTSPFFYWLSIILLAAVFIPGLSTKTNGAYRWLQLGPVVFQPVELLKLSLTVFFAKWLSEHQRLGPFLLLTLLPASILLLQPDMGSLLVVLSIAFGLYFVAGGKLPVLFGIAGAGLTLLIVAILFSPYRMQRVTTFLNPDADPLGASFHIRQITLALGNGSWFGQGIGNSKQKYSYIPEASSDSIFAIVAEEIGFIGSLGIMSLFLIYVWLTFKIVRKTKPRSFEFLFAMGILIWISCQIILNLSAVVALVPLTGLPLPFFSYGGSALIMILLATGISIKIGRSR